MSYCYKNTKKQYKYWIFITNLDQSYSQGVSWEAVWYQDIFSWSGESKEPREQSKYKSMTVLTSPFDRFSSTRKGERKKSSQLWARGVYCVVFCGAMMIESYPDCCLDLQNWFTNYTLRQKCENTLVFILPFYFLSCHDSSFFKSNRSVNLWPDLV